MAQGGQVLGCVEPAACHAIGTHPGAAEPAAADADRVCSPHGTYPGYGRTSAEYRDGVAAPSTTGGACECLQSGAQKTRSAVVTTPTTLASTWAPVPSWGSTMI